MALPLEQYAPGDPEAARVRRVLRSLGIDAVMLQNAALTGTMQADLTDENHPANYPGMVRYGETVGALRTELARRGWSNRTEDGVYFSVAPDGSAAVTAWSGDSKTGCPGEPHAQPKHERGPGSKRLIVRHANLELELSDKPSEPTTRTDPPMWVLLHSRDRSRVRLELNRVKWIEAETGRVIWDDRCVVPPALYGDAEPFRLGIAFDSGSDDGDDQSPLAELDVPVTPRTN